MKTREYFNSRNPLLPPDVFVPDVEAHVMPDGKLYLYGSYDMFDDQYCSGEYHVVSTKDLKHWTVHDVALRVEEVPWLGNADMPRFPGPDWTRPTPFMKRMLEDMMKNMSHEKMEKMAGKQAAATDVALYAPDCVYRDGKYYLYFCLSDNTEGVAVSDSPVGPFVDARRLPCGGIDPAAFVDEDGRAYYYWNQFFSRGVRLGDDMCSFREEDVKENLLTEEAHYFHEGSSMRKIKDTYYYIYADVERGKPTALGYATSKSPLGPFAYRGIIIDNAECDPQSWNNHGSIECVDGQWYVCYHRSSGNSKSRRRVCMEKITILEDGTIPEVKMTSQGLGEPFEPGEVMHGYQACGLRGRAYIDMDEKYGGKVTGITSGDEVVFRYVRGIPTYLAISVEARGTGRLRILLNDVVVGGLEISRTGRADGRVTGKINSQRLPEKKEGYELRLACEEADGLEILTVSLF